jgi:hypothetical protein
VESHDVEAKVAAVVLEAFRSLSSADMKEDDNYFERVVEWCAIREENHVIFQCHGPPGGC